MFHPQNICTSSSTSSELSPPDNGMWSLFYPSRNLRLYLARRARDRSVNCCHPVFHQYHCQPDFRSGIPEIHHAFRLCGRRGSDHPGFNPRNPASHRYGVCCSRDCSGLLEILQERYPVNCISRVFRLTCLITMFYDTCN